MRSPLHDEPDLPLFLLAKRVRLIFTVLVDHLPRSPLHLWHVEHGRLLMHRDEVVCGLGKGARLPDKLGRLIVDCNAP